MIRLLILVWCPFFMVIGMGGNTFAVPYTLEDTTEFNPNKYVSWWKNFSYSHELRDNTFQPFQVGEDQINFYGLSILPDSSKLIPQGANEIAPAPVPESATMLLFGVGLIGLAIVGRRRFAGRL